MPSVPAACPVTVRAIPFSAVVTIWLVVDALLRTRTDCPPVTVALTGSTAVTSTGVSFTAGAGVAVAVVVVVVVVVVEEDGGVDPSVMLTRSERIYPSVFASTYTSYQV